MTHLIYAAIIDPLEDSTTDNLRGLAYLADRASEASLETSLVATGGVLTLRASGDLASVARVARRASTSAIYPDVVVDSEDQRREALPLLKGSTGVLVVLNEPGGRRPDLVRIERRPSGAPATVEEAAELLTFLGYGGSLETIDGTNETTAGMFRMLLPHYGITWDDVLAEDGTRWGIVEREEEAASDQGETP